jgi:PhnB protein
MASILNPYISFDGNAKEALEFYREVFGGELELNTFAAFEGEDSPIADKIMHGLLATEAGYTIMAADTPPGVEHKPGSTIAVSLSGEDGELLSGYWAKLSESGTVVMPFQKQIWGDEFGQCVDRFGVAWMVNVVAPNEAAAGA